MRFSTVLLLLLSGQPLPVSAQLVERWVRRYDGPPLDDIAYNNDSAWAVTTDHRGDIIVTGSSYPFLTAYTAKYAQADGRLLWENRYRGPLEVGAAVGLALTVDSGGDVIMAGESTVGQLAGGFYVVKYAGADGSVRWENRRTATGRAGAMSVTIDRDGNVIAAGYISERLQEWDCFTVKLAAADGALLWEKRVDGPANGEDLLTRTAVDSAGNVFVTGHMKGLRSGSDLYTAKYAHADGTLLWEKHFDGPAGGDDQSWGLAIDREGNAFVSGYVTGAAHRSGRDGLDAYVAKYAGTDGALMWERIINGSGDGEDLFAALALDAGDNVIVTGLAHDPAGVTCTAKFSGVDGASIWERYDRSPDKHGRQGNALALDRSGNVFVTGNERTGGVLDMYAACYLSTDGALLWNKPFNGRENLDDHSRAIALTEDGGVVITGISFSQTAGSDIVTAFYASPSTAQPAWRRQYFDTVENAGAAADIADGDQDGLTNLVEWACGFDPTVFTGSPGTLTREGADFVFSYTRSTAAATAGAVYAVEWNDTPGGEWHTENVSEAIISNDSPVQQVRATLPAGPEGRRFVRLRVTSPP